ncbi:Ring finger and U-box domain [Eptesicus fuscus gammaherpesvirus]|uniref:Ring finger and U-box domain n=1 Tax=vespertilionid gammaherpesvirus 3 TaxID=2846598 RepID=A0A2D0ZPG7_9GAMA|nr:Ring finger and U-box domain [Eptesicus fuscus gammaherpesvirus]ATA58236.1 Ring finger and U-box domain [Eptesicus fuscus gammaherpesvirus]WAH70957.1 zinc-finger-RING-CH-type domain protein [Eptesicus fuscus gammaherpesvirus]
MPRFRIMEEAECEKMCRICQDNEGKMVAPCLCDGTARWAHPECILAWIDASGHRRCEVCSQAYETKEVLTSVFLWRCTPRLTKNVLLFLTVLAVSGASLACLCFATQKTFLDFDGHQQYVTTVGLMLLSMFVVWMLVCALVCGKWCAHVFEAFWKANAVRQVMSLPADLRATRSDADVDEGVSRIQTATDPFMAI